MCGNAITSIFSAPKVEKPKPAPLPGDRAVTKAGQLERQRAASAVTSATNTIVKNDQLDDDDIQRPQLLGSVV